MYVYMCVCVCIISRLNQAVSQAGFGFMAWWSGCMVVVACPRGSASTLSPALLFTCMVSLIRCKCVHTFGDTTPCVKSHRLSYTGLYPQTLHGVVFLEHLLVRSNVRCRVSRTFHCFECEIGDRFEQLLAYLPANRAHNLHHEHLSDLSSRWRTRKAMATACNLTTVAIGLQLPMATDCC